MEKSISSNSIKRGKQERQNIYGDYVSMVYSMFINSKIIMDIIIFTLKIVRLNR